MTSVFVSYADADLAAATRLAGRLVAAGIGVHLLEWTEPGAVEIAAQEDALRAATHGILLFSRATMRDAAIREEYAALLRLARSGIGRRFIPVRIDDVVLPEFAAIRRPVDLRDDVDERDYDTRLAPLVRVLRAAPRQPRGAADVVVVTALPEEHAAMTSALGDSCVGDLRVAVAPPLGMGNVRASVAAHEAVTALHANHVLLVGIAAGFPEHELCPGDVLVADQVVGFELAKLTPDGPRRRYESYRPDFGLLATARAVTVAEWVSPAPSSAPRPARARFGPVLSGEKVVAHRQGADDLRRDWPAALGVEMESHGVALAAYRAGAGFLMVKGVSDFADEVKDDRWRTYAARTAARFTVALLRRRAHGNTVHSKPAVPPSWSRPA